MTYSDYKIQDTSLKRNHIIDLMRFCGVIMVILAHTNPHPILMQIRTFDVPLLVVVSALSYNSTQSSKKNYLTYMLHRTRRLLIPVLTFFIGYFLILTMIDPHNPHLELNTMMGTFFLLEGIGYVWIIRVFLLIALISPILYRFHSQERNNTKFLIKIGILFFLYEISLYIIKPFLDMTSVYSVTLITHYAIPYGLIFAFGLRLSQLTVKEITIVSMICLMLFIICASLIFVQEEKFVSMWYFKYPPSAYYVSYSISAVCVFWMMAPRLSDLAHKIPHLPDVIRFISINSLWIYLWHIFFIEFLAKDTHFLFIIISVFSILTTFVQNRIYHTIFSAPHKIYEN